MAACGQARDANSSARPVHTDPAKAGFVVAADRICSHHLQTILAWLEKPQAGNVLRQQATQDAGIYRIIVGTVTRLQRLGPAPGPTAEAFAGYVKTLKARAALYWLTSMADLRHDRAFAARLQHRVVQIDMIGDREAHRYGLQVCGAGARDIAPPVERAGEVRA